MRLGAAGALVLTDDICYLVAPDCQPGRLDRKPERCCALRYSGGHDGEHFLLWCVRGEHGGWDQRCSRGIKGFAQCCLFHSSYIFCSAFKLENSKAPRSLSTRREQTRFDREETVGWPRQYARPQAPLSFNRSCGGLRGRMPKSGDDAAVRANAHLVESNSLPPLFVQLPSFHCLRHVCV